jgi:hypothetical protein
LQLTGFGRVGRGAAGLYGGRRPLRGRLRRFARAKRLWRWWGASTVATASTSDGIVEDAVGSGVGDYNKVCSIHLANTPIDVRVLVEATTSTHTIEKLTVFASGLTASAQFQQLGDGTGYYDAVNNAYHFPIYYQINGSNLVVSKQSSVIGVVYLNTGKYALRIVN